MPLLPDAQVGSIHLQHEAHMLDALAAHVGAEQHGERHSLGPPAALLRHLIVPVADIGRRHELDVASGAVELLGQEGVKLQHQRLGHDEWHRALQHAVGAVELGLARCHEHRVAQ